MKRSIGLLFLIFSALYGKSQITASNVDSIVKRAVDSVRFSGASILVAIGDRVIHSKGYGYAHQGFKVPASPGTKYNVTGPHLMVLGAVTMKFMERGKLNADDRIRKHLPDLPSGYDSILVRHLLTSTSGIPDYHYLGDRYEAAIGLPKTYDEVLARFIDLPLVQKPGAKFDWSISNFMILTMILEKISGKTYAELAGDLLRDLKLTSTGFIDGKQSVDELAPGYKYSIETKKFIPEFASVMNYDPSLRLYSTTEDMFAIWRAMLNGKLITKESFAMMTSVEEAKKNNSRFGSSSHFGYLVNLSTLEGKSLIHQIGALRGYSASFKYVPADDITIIVLSNTAVAQEAEAIMDRILRHVIKTPPFPIVLPDVVKHEHLAVPLDSLKAVTGTYILKRQIIGGRTGSPLMGMYQRTYRVFIEHDQLMLQALGHLPTPLLRQKDGSYRVVGSAPLSSIVFIREDDRVKSLVRKYDGQKFEDVGPRSGDADVRTFYKNLVY
jgi:CubicO group peptidase (beta-lactamase class C family)